MTTANFDILVDTYGYAQGVYASYSKDKDLRYEAYQSQRGLKWSNEIQSQLGEVLYFYLCPETGYSYTTVKYDDETVCFIQFDLNGTVTASVRSNSNEKSCVALNKIFEIVEAEPMEENKVEFKFWSSNGQSGYGYNRELTCPTWDEIRGNYTSKVRNGLETLITNPDKVSAGLMLWTGAPGTGKTTAIRGLARAWKEWCKVEVVSDPESLLGSMSYLNTLLLSSADYELPYDINGEPTTPKSRLIVLEDAGELISRDAALKTGTGPLSRLLNITDGLLGQGTNLKILITTNEEVGKLHEAVTRNGRCLSDIEFESLSRSESQDWLDTNEVSHNADNGMTIADLYAIKHNTVVTKPSKKDKGFGFAVA